MTVTTLRLPVVILNYPPEDKFCPNKRHQFAGRAVSPEQVPGYLSSDIRTSKVTHLLTRQHGGQIMCKLVLRSLRD